MAVVHTNRVTPTGIMLEEGGPDVVIAFERSPSFCIWEVETGGAGLDGGEPIDVTTQHNIRWESTAAPTLIKALPFTVRAGFNPKYWSDALSALLNQPGSLTEWYPDNSKLSYHGYLRMLQRDGMRVKTFPTVQATVVPTMRDPVTGAETEPIYVDVSGT